MRHPESVDDLGLSVRTANVLQGANIKTIAQLTQWTRRDLLKLKNMGRKSVIELALCLKDVGHHLKPEPIPTRICAHCGSRVKVKQPHREAA